MHMVRHHDDSPQIEFLSVVMETAFQHDRAHRLWQYPSVIGAEGYKMLVVIDLKVRKPPAVEGLRHGPCRDSRPRLSGGAKLRSLEV